MNLKTDNHKEKNELKNNHTIHSQLINNTLYSKNLALHHKNACAHVKESELIFEAIQLARDKNMMKIVASKNDPNNHPALKKLCSFWQCFTLGEIADNALLPFIQIFSGKEHYEQIINDANLTLIPQKLLDNQTYQKSNIIFSERFLVTFLSDQHLAMKNQKPNHKIYYTVHRNQFLEETMMPGSTGIILSCVRKILAWKLIEGLQNFPKTFPTIWQQLEKQRGIIRYEIH